MPSDAQRIQMIKFLIDQGYQQRVMMAHDIHTKHRLVSCYYGIVMVDHIIVCLGPLWWPWIRSHLKKYCT